MATVRACVVAEYYPRTRDPVLGIWAHRQAVAARAEGAQVSVLALERPVPSAGAIRSALRGRPVPLARSLAGIAAQPAREERDGVEIDYVRFAAPGRGRSYSRWDSYARAALERALDARLERGRFDLVHAHYALPAGAAARGWCERAGIPLVVSVHGGDVFGPLLATPAARSRVAQTLRAADRVLCNSAATLERSAALAGTGAHMEVVHLGAERPRRMPERHDRPTVVTLGHVVPRKRHEDVARAVAVAGVTVPSLRWVVIGDGPELPRVRAIARDLGIDATFTGELEHGEALVELARCHVMALPSVDEAFGVAYVEALACSVPAIGCAGEGGPEEIAAAGEGMLLVPPRDPDAVADAIEEALGQGEDLTRAARRTAEASFSWRRCGRATVAAYRAVLEGRRGGTSR